MLEYRDESFGPAVPDRKISTKRQLRHRSEFEVNTRLRRCKAGVAPSLLASAPGTLVSARSIRGAFCTLLLQSWEFLSEIQGYW